MSELNNDAACRRCLSELPEDNTKPCAGCGSCRNCASTKKPQRRGRCEPCAKYRLRNNGRERPLELVAANDARQIEKELLLSRADHDLLRALVERERQRVYTVYQLFNESAELIYVGITGRDMVRLKDHSRGKPWWREVASARFEHFDLQNQARHRELALIKKHQPRHNIEGKAATLDMSHGTVFESGGVVPARRRVPRKSRNARLVGR